MASKDGGRVETMALRSSRRGKTAPPPLGPPSAPHNCPQQPPSFDPPHHSPSPPPQQVSPKNEKETAPSLKQQGSPSPPAPEPLRRITRSAALVCKQTIPEPPQLQEIATPEDNLQSKAEQSPTCKKMVRLPSALSLSQPVSQQAVVTVKKGSMKGVDNLASPYSEFRKSYRKVHRREIISIPYRKCHDAFEGRVVAIINKIEQGKNCLRDFEGLIERLQRLSGPRDMLNRFVVSGIRTILRLGRHQSAYDPRLLDRLEKEQDRLRLRILDQLDRFDDLQGVPCSRQQVLQDCLFRRKLLRKVFRLARIRSQGRSAQQVKEEVLRDCQKFFTAQASVGTLIRFVRQHSQD